MFSDGIRPGGDLTELDGSDERAAAASGGSSRRHHRRGRRHHHHHHYSSRSTAAVGLSLLPAQEGALPLLASDPEGEGKEMAAATPEALSEALVEDGKRLAFLINKNLVVHVKIIKCKEILT